MVYYLIAATLFSITFYLLFKMFTMNKYLKKNNASFISNSKKAIYQNKLVKIIYRLFSITISFFFTWYAIRTNWKMLYIICLTFGIVRLIIELIQYKSVYLDNPSRGLIFEKSDSHKKISTDDKSIRFINKFFLIRIVATTLSIILILLYVFPLI